MEKEIENNFLGMNSKLGQTMSKIIILNKLAQRRIPEEYPRGWTSAIRGVISKRKNAKKVELEIENIAKKIPTKILNIGHDGKIKIELSRHETRCIDEIKKEEVETMIEKGQEWQKEIEQDLSSPIVKYWHHEATAEKIMAISVKGYLIPFGAQLCQYFNTLRSHKNRYNMAIETIMTKDTRMSKQEARKRLNSIIRTARRKIHHKDGTHRWQTCDTCQDMVQVNELMAEAYIITHADQIPRNERCEKLTEILTRMLGIVMVPKLKEKSNETLLQRALLQYGGIQFVGEENLPTIEIPKIKAGYGNMLIAHMTEFLINTVTMANCLRWSDIGTLRAIRKALPEKIREETEHIRSAKSLINYIANKFITQPLNLAQMEAEFEAIEFPRSKFPPMDMAAGLIVRAEEIAGIISLKKVTERKNFQDKLVRDMILAKFPALALDNCKNDMEKSGIFSYGKMKDFLTGKECTEKTFQEQRKLYELHQTPPIMLSWKNLKRKAMESQPFVKVKRMKIPTDITQSDMDTTPHIPPVLEIQEPFEELHVVITQGELEQYRGRYIPIGDLIVEKLIALNLDWTEEGLKKEVDYQVIKHGMTVVEYATTGDFNVDQ